MIIGPLFSLRIWGTICPCCENSENKSARASLQQLNQLGTRISWHTSEKKNSTLSAAAGGFMQSIFGRSSSNSGNNGGSQSQSSDDKPPTPASLKLVDATKDSINNGEPYPELQICPRKADASEAAAAVIDNSNTHNNNNGPFMKQNSAMSFQLDIPLHHIQRIESIKTTLIGIYTKDVNAIDENTVGSEKEAARVSFLSSDDRDTASLDLKVLLEWNKYRLPEGGIEDDLPGVGIKQRAQKAAHFAKREIEMREKKRDREKRKAGHMQSMSSGGLKYTAMAMANQVTT